MVTAPISSAPPLYPSFLPTKATAKDFTKATPTASTMSRVFYALIPRIAFLTIAFILSFLVSISLPFLPAFDLVRVNFGAGQLGPIGYFVKEIRLGIWTMCIYLDNNLKTCLPTDPGYEVNFPFITKSGTGPGIVTVGSAWTGGLVVHAVATAITFFALLFSRAADKALATIGVIVSFLAALLTLIAFAIDIALLVHLRNLLKNNSFEVDANTAPAFWMTFVSLIFLLLAGCTAMSRPQNRPQNRPQGQAQGQAQQSLITTL